MRTPLHRLLREIPGRCGLAARPALTLAALALATLAPAERGVAAQAAAPADPAAAAPLTAVSDGALAQAPAEALAEPRTTPAPRIGVVGSSLGARFAAPGADPALAMEPSTAGWYPLGADSTAPAAGGTRPVPAWRIAVVGGLGAGSALLMLDMERRRWWSDRRPHFRIMSDWSYSRWADKGGHFLISAFFTRTFRSSLRLAGLPRGQSRTWAAGLAWANMFYYEVLDGFGPDWGFSPGDLLFNTLGVAVATAQDARPSLQALDLKVSFWPSGWEGKHLFDDYVGQTYWLTVNPGRLGLAPGGRALPRWLGVAVGYGARDPDERDLLTRSVVYVGLDIDLAGIPIRHPAWRAMTSVLRYFHLPGPAIRLTPNPGFVFLMH